MVKKKPNNITLGTGTFQKYIYSKLSVRFINFYLIEFKLTSVAGFTLTLLLLLYFIVSSDTFVAYSSMRIPPRLCTL